MRTRRAGRSEGTEACIRLSRLPQQRRPRRHLQESLPVDELGPLGFGREDEHDLRHGVVLLEELLEGRRELRHAGRPRSPSAACGSGRRRASPGGPGPRPGPSSGRSAAPAAGRGGPGRGRGRSGCRGRPPRSRGGRRPRPARRRPSRTRCRACPGRGRACARTPRRSRPPRGWCCRRRYWRGLVGEHQPAGGALVQAGAVARTARRGGLAAQAQQEQHGQRRRRAACCARLPSAIRIRRPHLRLELQCTLLSSVVLRPSWMTP